VRHAVGLPSTSTYDCRGFSWGTAESCTFSNDAVAARAEAAAQYGAARTEVVNALGSACVVVDPSLPVACVPTFPATPSNAQIVPFKGAGKYFIAVRGFSAGVSEYNLVAAWG
jgi:hypothetical protein